MDRTYLPALAAASLALLATAAHAQSDRFKNTLAVQTAMSQGQGFLRQNQPGKAVEVLEAELTLIDGNRVYLNLLREAYQSYIAELFLSNQEALAKKYTERLRILDPAAAAALTARPASAPEKTTAMAASPRPPVLAALAATSATPAPQTPQLYTSVTPTAPTTPLNITARGKMTEEDTSQQQLARDLLARAEAEFAQKRYGPARLLFEQANHADQTITAASRDRWAYCKFNHVVELLNRSPSADTLPELEREVQTAMTLAPQMSSTGRWLLTQIAQRRGGGGPPASGTGQNVVVQHHPAAAAGWSVAETTHFRIFHQHSREFGEQAAIAAERTRLAMSRKWFGNDGEVWHSKCDIHLHATGTDYSRVTGVPAVSPGHSRIESDPSNGRVIGRRIDLHCDNPGVLDAVLPHETTHVVLAGQFGSTPVPRWVDEGVAVLTEPPEKVQVHRQNLARFHRERGLFSVRELMQMSEYPQGHQIGVFYAESVALVEFLSRQRDPQTFCRFVRDGLREGYESALRRHYGYRDFAELEERWQQQVLATLGEGGYAGR